jgi:hypothetical protein
MYKADGAKPKEFAGANAAAGATKRREARENFILILIQL